MENDASVRLFGLLPPVTRRTTSLGVSFRGLVVFDSIFAFLPGRKTRKHEHDFISLCLHQGLAGLPGLQFVGGR